MLTRPVVSPDIEVVPRAVFGMPGCRDAGIGLRFHFFNELLDKILARSASKENAGKTLLALVARWKTRRPDRATRHGDRQGRQELAGIHGLPEWAAGTRVARSGLQMHFINGLLV